MLRTLFHPSGQPSLSALREFLSVIPSAMVIADAQSSEVLALSPAARHLFAVSGDALLRVDDFLENPELRAAWLKELSAAGGKPVRRHAWVYNTRGERFPIIGSVLMSEVAGRQVVFISAERGYPDPEETNAVLA